MVFGFFMKKEILDIKNDFLLICKAIALSYSSEDAGIFFEDGEAVYDELAIVVDFRNGSYVCDTFERGKRYLGEPVSKESLLEDLADRATYAAAARLLKGKVNFLSQEQPKMIRQKQVELMLNVNVSWAESLKKKHAYFYGDS